MQTNKSKVINKLALVLISIVVLELILIGDQVQPVKAIKKKILLKKLKKVLPFLALVKPKKKIILLPIPIPMFNKQPGQHQYQAYGGGQHPSVGRPMMMATMNTEGSSQMPSFISSGHESPPLPTQMMMTQMMPNYDSVLMSTSPMIAQPQSPPLPQSFSMMMPSMTMTIENSQPAPGGGTSSIELSTMVSSNQPATNSSQSGALIQQQQMQQFDQFDEPSFELPQQQQQQPGGEYYYSSPWSNIQGNNQENGRRPPASPAKLLRNHGDRFRPNQQQQHHPFRPAQTVNNNHHHHQQQQQQQQQHHQQTVTLVTPVVLPKNSRLQQQQQQKHQRPMVPVLVIKNQWRPTTGDRPVAEGKSHAPESSARQASSTTTERPRPFRNQQQQQADYEELIPIGPPRLMPIYQTPNGQLHMSPPTERPQQQAPKRPGDNTIGTTNDSFDHERESPSSPAFGGGHEGSFQQPSSNQTMMNNNNEPVEVQTIPPHSLVTNDNLFAGGPHMSPNINNQQQQNEPLLSHNERPEHHQSNNNNQQIIKGKLQQPQQTTKRKPISGGGGY